MFLANKLNGQKTNISPSLLAACNAPELGAGIPDGAGQGDGHFWVTQLPDALGWPQQREGNLVCLGNIAAVPVYLMQS